MSDPLDKLKAQDPDLAILEAGGAVVAVSPRFQGRVFAALDGGLVHRLAGELLTAPAGNGFQNIGGNSLWPAPEGGPLAFNYPPGGGAWYVQDGIAETPAHATRRGDRDVTVEKAITLVNRAGTSAGITFRRTIRLLPNPRVAAGVAVLHYGTRDELIPRSPLSPETFLLAAWSLEQFAGGDGVTAFVDADDPAAALNVDFYGKPAPPPRVDGHRVWLTLGGKPRWQVGLRVAAGPRRIGALDPAAGQLVIRRTPKQAGRYFNIADNDQPRGPWSAADLYSVFNGGELGFYELETIAPLTLAGGTVGPSRLESETWIYRGPEAALRALLEEGA